MRNSLCLYSLNKISGCVSLPSQWESLLLVPERSLEGGASKISNQYPDKNLQGLAMNESSERALFGTDGIRGLTNEHPMTPEIAVRIGQAVTEMCRKKIDTGRPPELLIGKDTRLSGYMFESALAAGITSMGGMVQLVGPVPTPAVSYLTTGMRSDAGIVISASHNPYTDNGIKIFDGKGFKLPDSLEARLERRIEKNAFELVDSDAVGKAERIEDARGRYVVFLKNTFPDELTLEGMTVALDCANGAGYRVGPAVLRELGADVITTGCEPDGRNINRECGSLHPENVRQLVLEYDADIGISLDGDADRVLFVDEQGERIHGEQILALCALNMKRRRRLNDDTVVTTVMSNLGLDKALAEWDIDVERTKVGDRYVVNRMRQKGLNFGGEESGHLIFLDQTRTGDGMIAALQVLEIMQRQQEPFSSIADLVELYPNNLVNVPVGEKPPLETLEEFQKLHDDVVDRLGQNGRTLVRYSGTQPEARVLVEARKMDEAVDLSEKLAGVLEAEVGR